MGYVLYFLHCKLQDIIYSKYGSRGQVVYLDYWSEYCQQVQITVEKSESDV